MSADRDYWTELKQLLRWFNTPRLSPRLVLLVRACPAHLGSCGLSKLISVCPGSSGLVWARPSSSGLIRARLSWSGHVWSRPGSSQLVPASPGSLEPGLGPRASYHSRTVKSSSLTGFLRKCFSISSHGLTRSADAIAISALKKRLF